MNDLFRSKQARNAILLTLQHWSIRSVGDGKDVRWDFVTFDALVPFHDLFGVDRKFLVGIDNDTEKARVRLRGLKSLERSWKIKIQTLAAV